MKGIAAWIWIIMSVVLGILVITFGSLLLLNQYDVTQKQLLLSQFQDLNSRVRSVCNGGVGEVFYYKIAIPENTKAIYVANSSDQAPPDTVSDMITNSQSAVGNYLCMQFYDENIPICSKIDCISSFTYIGNPSLKPTLQNILARMTGQTPQYNFLIRISKTDYNFLTINATQTIGPQNPISITTTTRPHIV